MFWTREDGNTEVRCATFDESWYSDVTVMSVFNWLDPAEMPSMSGTFFVAVCVCVYGVERRGAGGGEKGGEGDVMMV